MLQLLVPPPELLLLVLVLEPPGVHSGGGAGLPRQISHLSHSLRQPACCVQGLQTFGSWACSTEQPTPSWMVTVVMLGSVTWQQPKQSQPFGVSPPQKSRHFCVGGGGQLVLLGS